MTTPRGRQRVFYCVENVNCLFPCRFPTSCLYAFVICSGPHQSRLNIKFQWQQCWLFTDISHILQLNEGKKKSKQRPRGDFAFCGDKWGGGIAWYALSEGQRGECKGKQEGQQQHMITLGYLTRLFIYRERPLLNVCLFETERQDTMNTKNISPESKKHCKAALKPTRHCSCRTRVSWTRDITQIWHKRINVSCNIMFSFTAAGFLSENLPPEYDVWYD